MTRMGGVASLFLVAVLLPAGASAQGDARLREARDACWREAGYAHPPTNFRGSPGLNEQISSCVRARMAAGGRGGPAPRR